MDIKTASLAQALPTRSATALKISAPARKAVSAISQAQLPSSTKEALIQTVSKIERLPSSSPMHMKFIAAVVDLGIFLEEGGNDYPKWEVMTGLRYYAGLSPNGLALPDGATFEDVIPQQVEQVSQQLAQQSIQQVQAKVALQQVQVSEPAPPPSVTPSPAHKVEKVNEGVDTSPPPPTKVEFA